MQGTRTNPYSIGTIVCACHYLSYQGSLWGSKSEVLMVVCVRFGEPRSRLFCRPRKWTLPPLQNIKDEIEIKPRFVSGSSTLFLTTDLSEEDRRICVQGVWLLFRPTPDVSGLFGDTGEVSLVLWVGTPDPGDIVGSKIRTTKEGCWDPPP